MNTILSTIPSSEVIGRDIRALANDGIKSAQEHIVTPLIDMTNEAAATTKDAMQAAKTSIAEQAGRVEKYTAQQCERTGAWLSANPFTGVSVGFAAGVVFSAIIASASRR